MKDDYLKLFRKMLEWEWYKDTNTKMVFIHMLLKANWTAGRFMGVEIPVGSFASSLSNLAAETNLSQQNVRTAIKHLKSTGEITYISHGKFTVFTINNYGKYQATNKQDNTQLTGFQQGANTEVTTIEERKKERKEEYNNTSYEVSPESDKECHVFATIRELYNSVCGSYPRLVKMSEGRKKAIKARLNTGYTVDDFGKLFEKAEASDFLRGKNDRNWSADFDWLIKDSNMAKVLEGKYDSKKGGQPNEPSSSVKLW